MGYCREECTSSSLTCNLAEGGIVTAADKPRVKVDHDNASFLWLHGNTTHTLTCSHMVSHHDTSAVLLAHQFL